MLYNFHNLNSTTQRHINHQLKLINSIYICVGDSLSYHSGSSFSTKDRERFHCNSDFKGGWWYNLCHYANLNGLYKQTSLANGVNWLHWRGHRYSLKTTEMKIRKQ